MNQVERDEVGKALSFAAVFYDRTDLDKTKISMLIDVLENAFPEATAHDFLKAIKSYRDDQKNLTFPAPARLSSYLRPSVSKESQAIEITQRIIKAINHCQDFDGYYEIAKEHVGEIGWSVILSSKGWSRTVHEYFNSNSNQFFAQMRDKIKSHLEIRESGIPESILINGLQESKKQLPEPIKFSEEETKQISETMKGQPRELVEKFIEGLAKKKEMERDQDSFLKRINPKTIEKGAS